MSSADLRSRIGELTDAAWALSALSVALESGLLQHLGETGAAATLATRCGLPAALTERLLDALTALGFVERAGTGYRLSSAAGELVADRARAGVLAAEVSNALRQAMDFADRGRRGADDLAGWHHTDPEILRSQGILSSGVVPMLARFVIPQLDDLEERLNAPEAVLLDVGSGVGAVTIAFCGQYPALRAVGLEPAAAPLAEARRNVIAAGLQDRVELRAQRVEDLNDEAAFDLVFLPIVFLPTDTLRAGLATILRALRPGGWVLMASMGAPGEELRPALARLRATLWGSEALSPAAVVEICQEVGYDEVREQPGPPGSTTAGIAARR